MPNITISVYVTDDEYLVYIKKKKDVKERIKELVRKELKKWKNLFQKKTFMKKVSA